MSKRPYLISQACRHGSWYGVLRKSPEQIGVAIESDDTSLWSDYIDDLQRLLWFIVVRDEGGALRQWMERAQYPMRYAPLYHAVVAAINGEDHLHRINPETRQPAARLSGNR